MAKAEINNTVTFSITCSMKERWISPFLSMLKHMESLGGAGQSRLIGFYADGDGDFQPKFEWQESLPSDAEPFRMPNGTIYYDAG